MSDGYRGLYPASEYPSRDTAIALIDALKGDAWEGLGDLERLTGLENVTSVAERCFMVYGYPDLEGVAVCRRIVERSDEAHRAAKAAKSARAEQSSIASNLRAISVSDGIDQQTLPKPTSEDPDPVLSPQDGYGFQRR